MSNHYEKLIAKLQKKLSKMWIKNQVLKIALKRTNEGGERDNDQRERLMNTIRRFIQNRKEIVELCQSPSPPEFRECSVCSAKSGSPTLCNACITNRAGMSEQNQLLRQIIKKCEEE